MNRDIISEIVKYIYNPRTFYAFGMVNKVCADECRKIDKIRFAKYYKLYFDKSYTHRLPNSVEHGYSRSEVDRRLWKYDNGVVITRIGSTFDKFVPIRNIASRIDDSLPSGTIHSFPNEEIDEVLIGYLSLHYWKSRVFHIEISNHLIISSDDLSLDTGYSLLSGTYLKFGEKYRMNVRFRGSNKSVIVTNEKCDKHRMRFNYTGNVKIDNECRCQIIMIK